MALFQKPLSLPPILNKQPIAAFVNWSLPLADGHILRSNKAFPIFNNPRYPNEREDILLDLAQKNGGTVTVLLECKITLNS